LVASVRWVDKAERRGVTPTRPQGCVRVRGGLAAVAHSPTQTAA
jgi:hypothetical protein